jgi:hypothetical protein
MIVLIYLLMKRTNLIEMAELVKILKDHEDLYPLLRLITSKEVQTNFVLEMHHVMELED